MTTEIVKSTMLSLSDKSIQISTIKPRRISIKNWSTRGTQPTYDSKSMKN